MKLGHWRKGPHPYILLPLLSQSQLWIEMNSGCSADNSDTSYTDIRYHQNCALMKQSLPHRNTKKITVQDA